MPLRITQQTRIWIIVIGLIAFGIIAVYINREEVSNSPADKLVSREATVESAAIDQTSQSI